MENHVMNNTQKVGFNFISNSGLEILLVNSNKSNLDPFAMQKLVTSENEPMLGRILLKPEAPYTVLLVNFKKEAKTVYVQWGYAFTLTMPIFSLISFLTLF